MLKKIINLQYVAKILMANKKIDLLARIHAAKGFHGVAWKFRTFLQRTLIADSELKIKNEQVISIDGCTCDEKKSQQGLFVRSAGSKHTFTYTNSVLHGWSQLLGIESESYFNGFDISLNTIHPSSVKIVRPRRNEGDRKFSQPVVDYKGSNTSITSNTDSAVEQKKHAQDAPPVTIEFDEPSFIDTPDNQKAEPIEPTVNTSMPRADILNVHASILKTGTALGYFPANSLGICNGFTLKWLSACLVGQEDKFNERVRTILQDEDLIGKKINRITKKIKSGKSASARDKDYLEILAFYEGMLLFQSPSDHPELFVNGVFQSDFELISPLASSDKMEALGGLITVHSDVSLYTQEGIEVYLNKLAERIDAATYDSIEPIGFRLISHNHAIGLTYNKTTYQWTFKDINNASSLLNQDMLTTKDISKEIFKGFEHAPSEKKIHVAIGTSIITSESTEKTFHLQAQLASFNNPLSITEELMHSEALNHLVAVAFNCKRHDIIIKLIHLGVDINQKLNDVNATLLMCAVVRRLYGLLCWLLGRDVDLDAQMTNGVTAVYLAAMAGDVESIYALAERGANLDIPDNKGLTPVWSAACNGYLSVLEELVKYNANMNTSSNDGSTPLFIAAQKGHTDVVKFLLENSQSQSVPFVSSRDSLQNFAKLRGDDVVCRMSEMIAFKSSQGADKEKISLLPQEIAWIMGHEEVMQAFSACSHNLMVNFTR